MNKSVLMLFWAGFVFITGCNSQDESRDVKNTGSAIDSTLNSALNSELNSTIKNIKENVVTQADTNKQQASGSFTLQSADGPVSLSDFKGRVVVLYFGYTSCPDICPTSLATMTTALKSLSQEENKQVQPIMISLDPERDTAEKLKEYVGFFMATMLGLTGSKENIVRIAKDYHVNFRKTDVDSALGYVVDHASIYFIIGKDGHLFSHLLHDATPQEITAKVRKAIGGS